MTGRKNFKCIQIVHQKKYGLSADQLQGLQLITIPIVEDLLTFNILLYDLDIVDGNFIDGIA